MWQWIDKVSPETSFRATRVLVRAGSMRQFVSRWTAQPSMLALLVEADPRPNVVIGGPAGIEEQIRTRMPAAVVAEICAALGELWSQPRSEETLVALVVWPGDGGGPQLVAMEVARAMFGAVADPPVKPGPLREGASPDERRRWLRKHAEIAIERVGGANMRACAARDEVAIVAVEGDGEISYGYAPRASYAEDFPEPVQLAPGETAACHAVLVDMGLPGDGAPYQAFRMVATASPTRSPGNRASN
jgi:hypothetical protein